MAAIVIAACGWGAPMAAAQTGTGIGAINGPNPLPLHTMSSSGVFQLRDPDYPGLRCAHYSTRATLTGADNQWGNGDGTNVETGCVDALYSARQTLDMFKNWLGRPGVSGQNPGIPIYVGLPGTDLALANETGLELSRDYAGRWATSMDVVASAFGRRIYFDERQSFPRGGTYVATSDIFAAMTEAYANQPASFDPPDYSVGEEIATGIGGPFRSMHDPSLRGVPNCWTSSLATADEWQAAGPMSHWFYLLAEGSKPTNGQPQSPTCNGIQAWGIGIKAAGQIYYEALRSVPADTYREWRRATLQAAKGLTPGVCDLFIRTKQAWDAISVPTVTGEATCTPLRLEVLDPLVATVGTPVTIRLKGNGGDGIYTFSAGGLPPGLTLDPATGVISGRPTTAGTYYPGLAVLSQGRSNFMQPPFVVNPKPA